MENHQSGVGFQEGKGRRVFEIIGKPIGGNASRWKKVKQDVGQLLPLLNPLMKERVWNFK